MGGAVVIANVSLQRFRLPLRFPLTTARGPIHERLGVLLTLESRSGLRGHGEAMPLCQSPGDALAEIEEWLARRAAELRGIPANAALARSFVGPPLARAALDSALLDLAARMRGAPLAATLAMRTAHPELPVNALLVSTAPAALASEARQRAAEGFACFKLKVGAAALADDLARVAALREAIGPGAALRLDANGGWSEAEAIAALGALERYGPEYVEEPVSGTEACARVRARTRVPIALDESVWDVDRIEHALKAGAADVLVLKPAALGGPRVARAIALKARDAGVDTVVTSFLDSAIGVAAALHCALTLPLGQRACGFATGALFERDLAALPVENGVIRLPAGNGLGIAPDPGALAACATAPRWEL
jgi:o-succinylbenzoate synthase